MAQYSISGVRGLLQAEHLTELKSQKQTRLEIIKFSLSIAIKVMFYFQIGNKIWLFLLEKIMIKYGS